MKNNKIISLHKLTPLIKTLKRQGKKIVTYNGSFDILQIGHIRTIREAKKQGDILIVLLNSDESIRSYKGPNRPIVHEKERSEIIASMEDVDFVCIFNDIVPLEILNGVKPDIHCNGPEWGKHCIERSIVESNGGKIYITKTPRTSSTSELIKKIIDVYTKPTVKAVFIDRDGTINENRNGYTYKIEDFQFISGVIEALRQLSNTEHKIIIVTNQSGIDRGYYTEDNYQSLTAWMVTTLQKNGIRIDKVYHCPHSPEENCSCRKPKIGMFLQAVKDFGISLNDSWFIGDGDRDVIAGRNANIKTIKIGIPVSKKLKLQPNYYAKDLSEATKIILS